MRKAVLLSIKPKYCELIASGKKTIEVRKTRPNLETPFKCYIYCTKDFYRAGDEYFQGKYYGKVIGEFICDRIIDIDCDSVAPFDKALDLYIDKQCCLTRDEFFAYTQGRCAFGFHISYPIIYDKPRELSEFYRKCEKPECEDCPNLFIENTPDYYEVFCCYDEKIPITRPPQSWGYVEELK